LCHGWVSRFALGADTAVAQFSSNAFALRSNPVLSVTPIAITPIAGAPISSVSIATITNNVDPNNGSDYTVVINWGDGTPISTGTITGGGTTPTVTGSHTYSTANTYPVTITISNNQGNTTPVNITETVTVRPGHLRRGSQHLFVRLGEQWLIFFGFTKMARSDIRC
jgi:hypothetical protein